MYDNSKARRSFRAVSVGEYWRANWVLLAVLGSAWLLNLLVFEVFVFHAAVQPCGAVASGYRVANSQATVVAMVADPQLTDETSYYSIRRGTWSLRLVEYYSDVFMKKSFLALQHAVHPDAVVVAGDMLDGARYMPGDAYARSLQRYNWVFQRVNQAMPVYNLSGNHDIGFGPNNEQRQAQYVKRFERDFGKINYHVALGGFDWIFLSACTVVPGQHVADAAARAATMAFLERVEEMPRGVPRVLMSHVPLHRAPHTGCGPLRTSSTPITAGVGADYINVLPQPISTQILKMVRPSAVFSGDDHDQCSVEHVVDGESVLEQTVGTFSWLQGNIWPSFAVVVLQPATELSPASLQSHICFLPPQMLIYLWYLVCAFLTALLLLLLLRLSRNSVRAYTLLFHSAGHFGRVVLLWAVTYAAFVAALLCVYYAGFCW